MTSIAYEPRPEAPTLSLYRTLKGVSEQDVWNALVESCDFSPYFFGAKMEADLRVGGTIVWSGQWQDKPYRDTGHILACSPTRHIQYLYFSNFSGEVESPSTRMRITIDIEASEIGTRIHLQQENCKDATQHDHSLMGWNTILDAIEKSAIE